MRTLVVVDDDPEFRQQVSDMLCRGGQFQLVGQASDGVAGVAIVGYLQPQLVIMGVEMPGMDGLAATRLIGREAPGTQVVLTSQWAMEPFPTAARAAGARAYIPKAELTAARVAAALGPLPGRGRRPLAR